MAKAPGFWSVSGRLGPLVATAIHDGHALRPDAAAWVALDEDTRLREEDPFTSCWTTSGDVRIVARQSRFEVDLNRPWDGAVYRRPDEAWGLTVWRPGVPASVFARSLEAYDAFYAQLGGLLGRLTTRFGRVAVLDLHSYNHRRDAPDRADDPAGSPDVNIGTSNMDRARWARVVDRFAAEAGRGRCGGRRVTVGENVRFEGGHMVRWIHARFPDSVCALAVEVKKIFMDEWTGRASPAAIAEIGQILHHAAEGVREELARA